MDEDKRIAGEPVASGVTLHMTPETVWSSQASSAAYEPEAFTRDGFIHCTNGEENLIRTGNRYYRDDRRPYVVLVIDIERVEAPVVYEDAARIFPHIYGSLNQDAVVTVRVLERAKDGTFLAVGNPLPQPRWTATATPKGSPEE